MIYMILISVASMVLQNGLFNHITKNKLRGGAAVYAFNTLAYTVCLLAFFVVMLAGSTSIYTVLLGLIFGVVTALANFYKMSALSVGPMHLTLLFTTSSMIIPTMSGIFFGEGFSFWKLAIVVVLVFFLYLSFEKKSGGSVHGKWFLCSLLAFLFQGAIGVLQKIHQSSVYKEETGGFLFVGFICAALYSIIRAKGDFSQIKGGKATFVIALVCGACTVAMNYINLKLSGMLPSQLFFPLVNGSAIILTSVVSLVLFKEKISRRQQIGLIGGILSLIAICLVP